jgi:exopolysaccharide production protein ExoQ
MVQARFRLRPFLVAYQAMLGTCFYIAFASMSVDRMESKAGESVVYQMLWGAFYAGLFVRILIDRKKFIPIIKRLSAPLLLVAISLSAYTIHGAHIESIIKLGMYIMTILFAAWAASVVPAEEFLENFYKLACVVAVFQLAAYPFLNQQSSLLYDPLERPTFIGGTAYAGLFAHKNLAGSFFSLGILIGLNKLTNKVKLTDIVFLTVQLSCLLYSGAMTPLISLFIAYVVTISFGVLRTSPSLGKTMFLFIFVGCALGYAFREDVLLFFSRDVGFTGRDILYANWGKFFLRRPFLGYGYAEFFSNFTNSAGIELNAMIQWTNYFNFESGYLQSAIDFGGAGLAIYIYIIIKSLVFGFNCLNWTLSEHRKTLLGVTIFIIISSFADTYITLHNSLYPAFLFYVYFQPKSVYQKSNTAWILERDATGV